MGCPTPRSCPVAKGTDFDDARHIRIPADTPWRRVYAATYGFAEPNATDRGNACFSPIRDAEGRIIPVIYAAGDATGALLETVFRGTDSSAGRRSGMRVPAKKLARYLLATVSVHQELTLLDLRDPELERLGVQRGAVASSSHAHYPCTQALAEYLFATFAAVDGIVWHSRQSEFYRDCGYTDVPMSEVAVLFTDRIDVPREGWVLHASAAPLLPTTTHSDAQRLANDLGITIVPDGN